VVGDGMGGMREGNEELEIKNEEKNKMKRRLVLLVFLTTVWLMGGCGDQPFLTHSETITIIQSTETPEPTKVAQIPKLTEGRAARLPTPPDNPIIIQLTNNPGWENEKPTWSPDSSQILFMSNRECFKLISDDERDLVSQCAGEWDLYLMDADGSNEIRLTDVQFKDGQFMASLRWFPVNERIAFTYSRFTDKPFEKVLAFSLDRAKQSPLGLDKMEVLVDKGEEYVVGSFDWSPDGKKYAYDYSDFKYYPDTTWNLVIIDEESGEEVFRKTKAGDTMCSIGAWSPDGEGILISCRESIYESHIDWIDLNGGTEQLLVEKGITPTWSPDGKWIVYYSTEAHGLELFHVESGEIIPFTNLHNDLGGYEWSWSPDGKWLAFSRLVETDVAKWDIFLFDMSWLEMEWEEE
jgi:Tol biopolymer transport system component